MNKKKVNLINGETYFYIDEGSSDKIIILLHGNLTSSIIFENTIELLKKDFRVIAVDMRGFGDSTYYRKINSISDLTNDLIFFMKALDIEKANIAGWSLGGAVAMSLASKESSKVEKLILINSVPHDGIPKFKHNEKGTEVFGEVYKDSNDFLNDKHLITPLIDAIENEDHEYIINHLQNKNFSLSTIERKYIDEALKQRNLIDVFWALANFNMSHEHNFYSPGTNAINNIHIDTLHIWGEEDKVVPEYMVLKNYNALDKISLYKKYSNTGHCPMIDSNKSLTKDIKEFLNN